MANESNGSNGTITDGTGAPTVCITSCCNVELRVEARTACQEYASMGLATEENCAFWEQYAVAACQRSCSNCENIAREIFNSCIVMVQLVVEFRVARDYCEQTRQAFLDFRCPSACIDKFTECNTKQYRQCNALCGNYNSAPGVDRAGCVCAQDRRFGGDVCEGQTLLDGFVVGLRGVRHNCERIPEECKNHRSSRCGFYKHCPVDACVIFNKSCPLTDTCYDSGTCSPWDARCYYSPKSDGEACDDGLAWTHSDTCQSHTCTGIPNKCQRDSVGCQPRNPCLQATAAFPGGCDPATGSCVYEPVGEGSPCASHGAGEGAAAVDGTCRAGLCRRVPGDACQVANCTRPGPCYAVPRCSPETGCLIVQAAEGTACDDGDSRTHNDHCIEGRCIGERFPRARYRRLSSCNPPASLPWLRYSADVPDRQVCFDQCSADPECSALSYGYQTCSIFGTRRLLDPDERLWGRPWRLQAAPPAQPRLMMSCFEKGGEGFSLYDLADAGTALVGLTVFLFLLVPMGLLYFFLSRPLKRTLLELLQRDLDEGTAPPEPESPTGSRSKVGITNDPHLELSSPKTTPTSSPAVLPMAEPPGIVS